jgi:acyl dehydratase
MSLEEKMAELVPGIGTETHVGPWLQMNQERIDLFARATGDSQWIHTDPERAGAESPYGRTIAHGFLTLSLIPTLMGTVNSADGAAMAINYGLNRVRFPSAVLEGSNVRARVTLMGVEPAEDALKVFERITVEIEGRERPGCVAEVITLLLF